jgi:hypothetical protein
MKGPVCCECFRLSRLLIVGSVAIVVLIAGLEVAKSLLPPSQYAGSENALVPPIETKTQEARTASPPSFEIAPMPHLAHPETAVAPSPRVKAAAPQLDANGFIIHTLANRIDEHSGEELRLELLKVREIFFVNPTASQLPANPRGQKEKETNPAFVDAILHTAGREELAGLPFRTGVESALARD